MADDSRAPLYGPTVDSPLTSNYLAAFRLAVYFNVTIKTGAGPNSNEPKLT